MSFNFIDHSEPTSLVECSDSMASLLAFDMTRQGRTVHFQPLAHIALPQFYEQRRAFIDQHLGDSVVLAEGPSRHKTVGLRGFAKTIKEIARIPEDMLARVFRGELVTQREALPLSEEGVIAADCTYPEMVPADPEARAKLLTFRSQLQVFSARIDSLSDEEVVGARDYFRRSILTGIEPDLLTQVERRNFEANRDVRELLTQGPLRDERLLEHIRSTASAGRDSIIPWGASHTPNLVKNLENEGWRVRLDTLTHTPFLNLKPETRS